MTQHIGAKEFRFIEHSGAYFGFVFGLIQMVIYLFYKVRGGRGEGHCNRPRPWTRPAPQWRRPLSQPWR